MIHNFLGILELVAVAAAAASIAYYVACLWSAARFLREARSADKSVRPTWSPVSILKPLKGTDPHMYECFRSHCLQNHPGYEIIFGVSDPDDPAVALIERLKAEFPHRAIRLIVCRGVLGTNLKVSNLAQMLPEARYENLIVNDGDIRVAPDYLERVLAPLAKTTTGLVTCLYRGIAADTLGSRLEALGISTDFCPGVLVARQVEGIKFGLGSTLVFRRRDLQAIGGFEALADYLADDYQLGHRLAALGMKVELSELVVETFLPAYSLSQFFRHQLRWARTLRDSRFRGYVGMGVTFGIPWALLSLICAHGAGWAWDLLALTLIMRVAVAGVVGRTVLRDRSLPGLLALLPVRDVIAMLVWVLSFIGHKVSWRGESFRLRKGKLEVI